MKWYVLACESGREKGIIEFLEKEAKLRNLEKHIGKIIEPHHVEEHRTDEGWKERRVKSFPGYMLIQMNFCDATYLLIEDSKRKDAFGLLPLRPNFFTKHPDRKKVTKKLNLSKRQLELVEDWVPTAVDSLEAALILLRTKQTEAPPVTTDIKPGVRVTITDPKSPFKDQIGKVQNVIKQAKGFEFVVEITIVDRPVSIRISHKSCEATIHFESRRGNVD